MFLCSHLQKLLTLIETLNGAEETEKRIEKQARQAHVFCILVQNIFFKVAGAIFITYLSR